MAKTQAIWDKHVSNQAWIVYEKITHFEATITHPIKLVYSTQCNLWEKNKYAIVRYCDIQKSCEVLMSIFYLWIMNRIIKNHSVKEESHSSVLVV